MLTDTDNKGLDHSKLDCYICQQCLGMDITVQVKSLPTKTCVIAWSQEMYGFVFF